MTYSIRSLKKEDFPSLVNEIADPPKQLFIAGELPPPEYKFLCIVGSRKYTDYGRQAAQKIISGLAGYPIVIVSGLALGIDSIAHKSALETGLKTLAIPGSGLSRDVLYPRSHLHLAEKIVQSGGTLLSEYENDFQATPWSFPKRNRIMAGISHAVLVIEAMLPSGTLITSRLATEYNRDVFIVPGSIFSKQSEGPHALLRLGATPITGANDILSAFGFDFHANKESRVFSYENLTSEERVIVELLSEPISRDEIIKKSNMPVWQVNMILSSLEIQNVIIESMGEVRLV